MLEIELITNRLMIYSINNNDYSDILRYYQDKKNYFYATGENNVYDLDGLHNKIMSKKVDNYFFCASRLIGGYETVGCISGFIDTDKCLLWIYMLIVDINYQRLGYGSDMFHSVLKHLSESFTINTVLIGVADENIVGTSFWKKQGFSLYNRQNSAKDYKIYMFRAIR